jgi:hypothetical protein
VCNQRSPGVKLQLVGTVEGNWSCPHEKLEVVGKVCG